MSCGWRRLCSSSLITTDYVGQPEVGKQRGIEKGAHMRNAQYALDDFHGQQQNIVHFLDRVNGDDVWMVQRRSGAGFLLKAAESVGVAGEGRRKDFDRDSRRRRGSRAR